MSENQYLLTKKELTSNLSRLTDERIKEKVQSGLAELPDESTTDSLDKLEILSKVAQHSVALQTGQEPQRLSEFFDGLVSLSDSQIRAFIAMEKDLGMNLESTLAQLQSRDATSDKVKEFGAKWLSAGTVDQLEPNPSQIWAALNHGTDASQAPDWTDVAEKVNLEPLSSVEKILPRLGVDLVSGMLDKLTKLDNPLGFTAATRVGFLVNKSGDTALIDSLPKHPSMDLARALFTHSTTPDSSMVLKAAGAVNSELQPWEAIASVLPDKVADLFTKGLIEQGPRGALFQTLVKTADKNIRRGWIQYFLKLADKDVAEYIVEVNDKATKGPYRSLTSAFIEVKSLFPDLRDSAREFVLKWLKFDYPFAKSVLESIDSNEDVAELEKSFARSYVLLATLHPAVWAIRREFLQSHKGPIEALFRPIKAPAFPIGDAKCPYDKMTVSADGICECTVTGSTYTLNGCECAAGLTEKEGVCTRVSDYSAMVDRLIQKSPTDRLNALSDLSWIPAPQVWAALNDGSSERQTLITETIREAVKDIVKYRQVIRMAFQGLATQFNEAKTPFLKGLHRIYLDALESKDDDYISEVLLNDFFSAIQILGLSESEWSTADSYGVMSLQSARLLEDENFQSKWSSSSGFKLIMETLPIINPSTANRSVDWPALTAELIAAPRVLVEIFLEKLNDDSLLSMLDQFSKTQTPLDFNAATIVTVALAKKNPSYKEFERILNGKYSYPNFARLLANYDDSNGSSIVAAAFSVDPVLRPWKTISTILPSEAKDLFTIALNQADESQIDNLRTEVMDNVNFHIKWVTHFSSKRQDYTVRYLKNQMNSKTIGTRLEPSLTKLFILAGPHFPDNIPFFEKLLSDWAPFDGLFAISVLDRLEKKEAIDNLELKYAKQYLERVTKTREAWDEVKDFFNPKWDSVERLFEGKPPVIPEEACKIGSEKRDGECKPCGKDAEALIVGGCRCKYGFKKLQNGDCQKNEKVCTAEHMELVGDECKCITGYVMDGEVCIPRKQCSGQHVKWIANDCKCEDGYTMDASGLCKGSGLMSLVTSNPIKAGLGAVTTLGLGAVALRQLRRPQQTLEIKTETKKPLEKAKESVAWKWIVALVFLLIAILAVVAARYYSRLLN